MTPHNNAKKEDVASSFLFPGDPKRAKFVADNFLKDAKLVSDVRGQVVYTGYYKDKKVSIMSSGMGSASAGIYAYELFEFYNVENIIRIGTSGGLTKDLKVGDLVFALTASTDTNYAHQFDLKGTLSPSCNFSLLEKAVQAARTEGFPHQVGMVFSSDLFSSYNALGSDSWKKWAECGAIAQDMETYALYALASRMGKKALSILTMTDSLVTNESFKDEERMSGNSRMIITALEALTV